MTSPLGAPPALPPAPDPGAIQGAVLDWYARHARDLPWRAADRSPWGVLVSEIMLQQTPVVRVLPVWREWLTRWPEPADLAAEAPGEAVRAWGRLGYPRRALRLHEAARAIVDRHGGAVPDDHAALLALPGVGAYTAAAVASFAFGQRHVVLDTNVRRVLARVVEGHALPSRSITASETALASSLVPEADDVAARWAVASMELGALVCTARTPRCGQCPLSTRCAWRALGRPEAAGARAARPAQRWHGTDRQMRGRIMALLRSAEGVVAWERLQAEVPEADGQRERCIDSLVADGLAEPDDAGLRLPGTAGPPRVRSGTA